ncbi:dusp1-a, partial [Symbiodinium necroappetens]
VLAYLMKFAPQPQERFGMSGERDVRYCVITKTISPGCLRAKAEPCSSGAAEPPRGLRLPAEAAAHRRSTAGALCSALGAALPLAPLEEFLEQLGRLECQLFGKPTPSLQAEEVFAGRRMLNVDGAPSPVMQEPGHSPEMMHELEALQQVMQSLNSQLQLIGAEADAAAKEVAHHNVDSADGGGGHMAESPRRDENQTAFVARRYVSKLTLPPKQMDEKSLPELKRERDACEALLDFMARTAAALLDQRDHLREQLPTQGTLASEGTPSEEGLRRPIV